MKKVCLFIMVLSIACCYISIGQGTGYVTLKGRQFYDTAGLPFFPMVMNYHVELTHDDPNNPQYKIIRSTIYGTADCELEGGYTFNNCETSLAQDFAKMKQMGFNTIRLVGALSPNRNDSGVFGFHTLSGSFYDLLNNPSSFCKNKQTIGLDAPYTNSDAQSFFNLIAHFMDVAQSSNMKVILLCADGSGSYVDANGNTVYYPDRGSSLADAQDYAAFLHQLALAINSKPALLAYDLYNEPNYSWYLPGRNMDKNKQTVCDYFALWYDAIKAADPNHLITIGGTDYSDVFHWDTGVMKLDFVSVHYYPERDKPYETERLINQHHWFTEALGKPWIVGETGFSSSGESCLIPYLDGDNAAQLVFMQAILPSVRDCGGSGFSWWEFQDKHWYCVPDAVCNPTCANCDNWGGFCGFDFELNQFTTASIAAASNNILGNYHSLLAYGDPDPLTGLYDDLAIDKPAVAFTTAFDEGNGTPAPAACTAPTAYYDDPYHQGDFNTDAATYVTGFIQDQDGRPLLNAAVLALNWLETDDKGTSPTNDDEYDHSWIYTFANNSASGSNFSVIPYTPNHPNDPRIVYMVISSTGASKQELGQPYPWTDVAMNTNAGTVILNKIYFEYDGQIKNTTVTTSSLQQNYSGWNTLTASNVTVQSGAVSDWKARQEVNLQADFNAQSGSEVHIYTGETFAECPDYTGFARVAQTPANDSSSSKISPNKGIELTFVKNNRTKPDAEIIPNPATGLFVIKMLNVDDANLTAVRIKNMVGRQVRQVTFAGSEYKMDMSHEARGIYMVEITTGKNRILKKLIIN